MVNNMSNINGDQQYKINKLKMRMIIKMSNNNLPHLPLPQKGKEEILKQKI